jgi:hypothetical protein
MSFSFLHELHLLFIAHPTAVDHGIIFNLATVDADDEMIGSIRCCDESPELEKAEAWEIVSGDGEHAVFEVYLTEIQPESCAPG